VNASWMSSKMLLNLIDSRVTYNLSVQIFLLVDKNEDQLVSREELGLLTDDVILRIFLLFALHFSNFTSAVHLCDA